jgi:hypothetical protein
MTEIKRCSKCGEVKPINEFYYRKDTNKYRNNCKECQDLANKKWHKNNPEYSKEQSNKWRKENPVRANAICKKYRDSHKEERYITCTNWRINNSDKANEIQKRCYTKRRKTPKGNLDHRMEVSIRKSLNGNKNGICWEKLVGYNISDLKKHLENLFITGMNWEKFLKGEIHIDHKIPKSWFKFTSYKDKEFKECWSLKNLQPLWAEENIRKHNKILLEVS